MSQKEYMDDDIDLIEVFRVIWQGKSWVLTLAALFCLLGFGYTQTMKPEYQLKVSYHINLFPIFNQQFCELTSDSICLNLGTLAVLSNSLNGFAAIDSGNEGWKLNDKAETYSFHTYHPLSIKEYTAHLDTVSKQVTQKIRTQAELELNFIQNELTDLLSNNERVLINMLNARRTIDAIDSGERAVEFYNPIIQDANKMLLILTLSLLLGLLVGVIVVLIRNSFKQRHQIQTTA